MSLYVRPRKRLGQHFLRHESDAEQIVASLRINPGDAILEIGPGEGILTQCLLRSEAASVTCIELDERLVPWLSARFGHDDRFRVIHADFLDWKAPEDQAVPFRVIGNLPYYITSPILFRLLDLHPVVSDATVMVQKEVGQRLISGPGNKDYGIPSVLFQLYAEVRECLVLHREAFVPPPKVDSMVIGIRFYPEPVVPVKDPDHLKKLLKTVFGQRRKMLRNTVRPLLRDGNAIGRLEFDLTRRPEELTPEAFVTLSQQILSI